MYHAAWLGKHFETTSCFHMISFDQAAKHIKIIKSMNSNIHHLPPSESKGAPNAIFICVPRLAMA